jgi:hypothetical protein
MEDADIARTGLAQVMERFPEWTASLQRLALIDPEFREICEEYALARKSLAGFEARLDAAERPEVGEYRTIIAEIETEISRRLKEAMSEH